MKKRKCAVCGDLVQTNVKLKWRRDCDHVVFHVCMLCAESGKVNADSVKKESAKSYTTYMEEVPPYVVPHIPNARGKAVRIRHK